VALRGQIAGLKHQNEVQQRIIVAQAPSHHIRSSPKTDTQCEEASKTVPYDIYETAVRQNVRLREQLDENVTQRKLEASARSVLMERIRTAKDTAHQWEKFFADWKMKQVMQRGSSRTPGSGANFVQSPSSRLDIASPQLPEFEDLDAALAQDGEVLGISKLLQWQGDHEEYPGRNTSVQQDASATTSAMRKEPLHSITGIRSPVLDSSLRASRSRSGSSRVESHVQSFPTKMFSKKPSHMRESTSSAPPVTNQNTSHESINSALKTSVLRPHTTIPTLRTVPDDTVEFISERNLKRQRSKKQPRRSDSRLLIKQEPSSPTIADFDQGLFRSETVDLDDLGAVVDTPRKRRSEPLLDSHESLPLFQDEPAVDGTRTVKHTGQELAKALVPIDPNIRSVPRSCNLDRKVMSKPSDLRSNEKMKHFMQVVDEAADDDDTNLRNSTRIRDESRLTALLGGQLLPPPRRKKRPIPQSPKQFAPAGTKQRLRDKPLNELTLGDFKHNPRINHDEFDNQRSRECLPGCTDPRCCGEAMREIARTAKFLKIPREPMPRDLEDIQLSDDELLIKWHLGNRWCREEIVPLEPHQFNELLLDARTALLAQRYGKHKAEEERRRTPIGYWAMDMPDTQELALQHKEAHEADNILIKYRWNEARKGNGKWIFIDE
jgi:hypothetical protein